MADTFAATQAKRTAKRRRLNMLISACGAGMMVGLLTCFLLMRHKMSRPVPYEHVVAWTGDTWYAAYCDEQGTFHSAEDGHVITQVWKWTRP